MSDIIDRNRINKWTHGKRDVFISILPPDQISEPLIGAERLFDGFGSDETVSLEVAGDRESQTFGVRGTDPAALKGQLEAHFPQAKVDIPKLDPMRLGDDEQALVHVLTVDGHEQEAIRTFKDEDIQSEGSDPQLTVAGIMQLLRDRERGLIRFVLKPKPRDYFSKFVSDASMGQEGVDEHDRPTAQVRQQTWVKKGIPLFESFWFWLVCALFVLAGVMKLFGIDPADVIRFIARTELGLLMGIAGFIMAVALIVSVLIWQLRKGSTPKRSSREPSPMPERLDHRPFDLEIQVIVFVRNASDWRKRARELADRFADGYAGYSLSHGSGIVRRRSFDRLPDDPLMLVSRRRRLWLFSPGSASVIGARELAGLWHLPATSVRPRHFARSSSRHWSVNCNLISEGTPVGVTTAGEPTVVRLSGDGRPHHQFYAGGSGTGKTTLMSHSVIYAMRQKALGENSAAIVVVDPHGDMISDLLARVPPEVAHHVRLIDLSDPDRVAGINVLSPEFSPNRDATAALLVDVMSRHWEFWGPDMASILSHSVMTLHEANSHPDVPREEAYTLLDVRHLWRDGAFRRRVLEKVSEATLHRFWIEDFPTYEQGPRMQARIAIANRLMEYSDSKVAAAIVGQRFSTIDLKASIHAGNIILVSAHGSSVGGAVARLMGSYILMMIDNIIEAEGVVGSEERQRVTVVVDELQMLRGVPLERMLNNWRKFGGNLLLGTQTLSALRRESPQLEASLLTNVDVLVTLRVGAEDAAKLADNLGRDHVSERDILSLDPYNAFVRLRHSEVNVPPFSMKVLPPPLGNPAVAAEIRRRSARYTQSMDAVHKRQQKEIEKALSLNTLTDRRRRARN